MAAIITAIRAEAFECGCVVRFTDMRDGGWTWSRLKAIYTCAACRAHHAHMAAEAQLDSLARALRASEPASRDAQLADLAAALTASVR
jgi:hypothetical protein